MSPHLTVKEAVLPVPKEVVMLRFCPNCEKKPGFYILHNTTPALKVFAVSWGSSNTENSAEPSFMTRDRITASGEPEIHVEQQSGKTPCRKEGKAFVGEVTA